MFEFLLGVMIGCGLLFAVWLLYGIFTGLYLLGAFVIFSINEWVNEPDRKEQHELSSH